VTEFLVELYLARTEAAAVRDAAARARAAAEGLTREGTQVSFLRSIFVPEDETCFFLFEADSADAVREAQKRAAIPAGRIGEAL
jgi:Protein of unknown function (DUF4242)